MTTARIRLPCVVPFCRRTFKNGKLGAPWPDGVEVLCRKHYSLASKHLRVLRGRFRARKAKLKRGADYKRGWVHLRISRADRTDTMLWDRIKRQAIERAVGIA
jgi:hypothetical protein